VPLNDTILSVSLFRSDKIVPDKRVIGQFGLIPIHENGSYLRLDLLMQIEENHTLFIDYLTAVAQFTKKKVPIAVTIYTLPGEECKYSTLVISRERILNYNFKTNKILEPNIRSHGKDKVKVFSEVAQLVKGSILIGYETHRILEMLKSKKENLIGIRDLSTAPIFQRKGLQADEGKFTLLNIAKRAFRTLGWQSFKLQKGKIVREVYNVLRHDWIDTFD